MSNEHSKSTELQGKEIKIVTSSLCVDTLDTRGLNISRRLVVKRLPCPLYCICFSIGDSS